MRNASAISQFYAFGCYLEPVYEVQVSEGNEQPCLLIKRTLTIYQMRLSFVLLNWRNCGGNGLFTFANEYEQLAQI